MRPTPEPVLLSVSDAAELLGVSPDYLRRSDAPRLALPARTPNGKPMTRYDTAELVAWARAHRVGAA